MLTIQLSGKKNMNKGSPTYVKSIFSFTIPSTKHQIEQLLARWQAAKRKCKDEPIYQTLKLLSSWLIPWSKSIACPTNWTMKDLSNMETNNNSLKVELTIIWEENYLQRPQLENNNKLLNFYTGFNYLTVFEFITKSIVHSGYHTCNSQPLTATWWQWCWD